MYKVKQSDLIIDLKGYPIEVVQMMLNYQKIQTGTENVSLFQTMIDRDKVRGGFDWSETVEGRVFWERVINGKHFDIFFERYPKKPVYYKGVKDRGHEIIEAFENLGGNNNYGNYNCENNSSIYFLNSKKQIRCICPNDGLSILLFDVLKMTHEEAFLPEIKIEYTMQEIADKLGINVKDLRIKK